MVNVEYLMYNIIEQYYTKVYDKLVLIPTLSYPTTNFMYSFNLHSVVVEEILDELFTYGLEYSLDNKSNLAYVELLHSIYNKFIIYVNKTYPRHTIVHEYVCDDLVHNTIPMEVIAINDVVVRKSNYGVNIFVGVKQMRRIL